MSELYMNDFIDESPDLISESAIFFLEEANPK